MMGPTKLSTIRAQVREAFEKAGLDPAEWFGEQIRQVESEPSTEPGVLESLRLIRDALAEEVKARTKKPHRRASAR